MKTIKSFFALALLVLLTSCNKGNTPILTEKTYIVISDLHLGDSRSVSEGYGWNKHMKDTLAFFLDYLEADQNWDELIVAGDLFEEWTSPADVAAMRDNNGKIITEAEFFQKIVTDNQAIFDKFRRLKNSGRKLVYIPGNHDMLTTNNDFNNCLSGIFEQARTVGVDGMGEYSPNNNLYIEHGHRYDILNAPYTGKCGVDDIPESSILPPGFFECKIYTSSKTETTKSATDAPILDKHIYDILWDALGKMFGERDVVTGLDGMTKTYSFSEYAGSQCLLFNKIDDLTCINDGWAARCNRNKAYMVPSITTSILSGFLYDYCDQMGLDILESGASGAHILVWGHSHSPKLLTCTSADNKKAIYLNTGCWVDGAQAGAENTGTFGKITKLKGRGYEVSLCRFDIAADGSKTITTLGTESL